MVSCKLGHSLLPGAVSGDPITRFHRTSDEVKQTDCVTLWGKLNIVNIMKILTRTKFEDAGTFVFAALRSLMLHAS